MAKVFVSYLFTWALLIAKKHPEIESFISSTTYQTATKYPGPIG